MVLNMSPATLKPPPAKKAPAPIKHVDSGKHAHYKDAIDEVFGVLSMASVMIGWKADAGAFAVYGSHCSEEIASVADEYEQVGNAVDYLAKGSIWLGLAAALMPLGMQLAVNHGLIPEKRLQNAGVHSKQSLEDIIEIQLAEREAAIIRERAQSQKRLHDLRAEVNQYIDELQVTSDESN